VALQGVVAGRIAVFGLYAGSNYFALVHHLQHQRGKDLACIAYLRDLSDSITSITLYRSRTSASAP
jgi:hypothetical protein